MGYVSRSAFTQGALYEIGAAMTFFVVKNYADEFLSALDHGFKPSAGPEGGDDPIKNKISYKSPIGEALLGHKRGQFVVAKVPMGDLNIKILKLEN